MILRESQIADSGMIAEVIRQSILELCFDDHNGNADILKRWLANKTTGSVAEWISESDHYCVTATNDKGSVIGFGMLHRKGELKLLYLSPEHIGTGVGRKMLQNIENHAASWDIESIFLDSTNSALKFYGSHGYTQQGSCTARPDGLSCNSLIKRLGT